VLEEYNVRIGVNHI